MNKFSIFQKLSFLKVEPLPCLVKLMFQLLCKCKLWYTQWTKYVMPPKWLSASIHKMICHYFASYWCMERLVSDALILIVKCRVVVASVASNCCENFILRWDKNINLIGRTHKSIADKIRYCFSVVWAYREG